MSKPYEAHQCNVTGEIITSRHQERDHCKRHGIHVVEKGEEPKALKNFRETEVYDRRRFEERKAGN